MTIEELSKSTVNEMIRLGLTEVTAWAVYSKVYKPIIKLHKEGGYEKFNQDIINSYTLDIEKRLAENIINYHTYRQYILGKERLEEMHEKGEFTWKGPKFNSRFKLNNYYQNILDEYIEIYNFSVKGRSDATWIAKKYFAWLITQNHSTLTTVSAVQIQQFMIFCSNHMCSSSIHNVKLYMRKLYCFLNEKGYQKSDFKGLFDFKVSRESKMYPAADPKEISKVLDSIDKNLPLGKRNYAIILLGIVTGLRAIDIAKLKLSNIDWIKGEIAIVQRKTGKDLILPLTEDVGEAIKDYLLNGRPKNACDDSVFIRARAPLTGLTNGISIGDMFDDYRKKLGMPREAFDGKSFHSLRRYVGKNMITSGVSVNTLAQVLGDKNLNSVKKYISLDTIHLKECALDFQGIEMEVANG